MKFLLSTIALTLFLSGCAGLKPGCIVKDRVAAAATSAIVEKLECANSFAVKTDVDRFIESLGICKSATGPIADGFCPLACSSVVDFVAKNAIPKSWECSAKLVKADLYAFMLSKCKLIPVDL